MPEMLKQEVGTILKPQLIGQSLVMTQLFNAMAMIARRQPSTLIEGETGTGKELVARQLHELSERAEKPFVPVDCATIPKELAESELFGHEAGAFTGAKGRRIGYFEEAQEGTVFLDEVSQIPRELQPKLLRVLQERQMRRLGSNKLIPVDVWVIAATNRKLEEIAAKAEFPRDLMYRLNVVKLAIAPLRERKDDIPLLVEHFLREQDVSFTSEAMRALQDYNWPGNVRELQNVVISCATFLEEGQSEIGLQELPRALRVFHSEATRDILPTIPPEGINLVEMLAKVEERYVRAALMQANFDRHEASRLLGIECDWLMRRMEEFHIGVRR